LGERLFTTPEGISLTVYSYTILTNSPKLPHFAFFSYSEGSRRDLGSDRSGIFRGIFRDISGRGLCGLVCHRGYYKTPSPGPGAPRPLEALLVRLRGTVEGKP